MHQAWRRVALPPHTLEPFQPAPGLPLPAPQGRQYPTTTPTSQLPQPKSRQLPRVAPGGPRRAPMTVSGASSTWPRTRARRGTSPPTRTRSRAGWPSAFARPSRGSGSSVRRGRWAPARAPSISSGRSATSATTSSGRARRAQEERAADARTPALAASGSSGSSMARRLHESRKGSDGAGGLRMSGPGSVSASRRKETPPHEGNGDENRDLVVGGHPRSGVQRADSRMGRAISHRIRGAAASGAMRVRHWWRKGGRRPVLALEGGGQADGRGCGGRGLVRLLRLHLGRYGVSWWATGSPSAR